MFHFKQFSVDQTGCAMKINTDGVLLGALANAEKPNAILDIGTGTGVIALMLAQRFGHAQIDTVEIDETAAATAARNFSLSRFADRITGYYLPFQHFFKQRPDKKYDLIVSNPPFHLNSLLSTGKEKAVARHTGEEFFAELIRSIPAHLTPNGKLALVLPEQAATLVKKLTCETGLYLQEIIQVRSYLHSAPHREIISFGFSKQDTITSTLDIYSEPKIYSAQYRTVLSNFLTIF